MLGLTLIHVLLLGWLGQHYSPTQDEIAHLPAGLLLWKEQDFSVYRVNPPLVRWIAAAPVTLLPHQVDWTFYRHGSDFRQEWALGRQFINANREHSLWLMTLARWTCIPFSIIGLWTCFLWAKELTSPATGLFAATFWCFSPNILGHGALITPDIAATALGLLAAWRFSRWRQLQNRNSLFLAGVSLGLALLTKSYWITLLGIWPVLTLIDWKFRCSQRSILREAIDVTLLLCLALNILNLGYLFQGTGTPLKDFGFYSTALSGRLRIPGENLPGNRFLNSWLGEIPVPFPRDYVTGIDLQKVDFEQGTWNYFLGEVKQRGGWWNYYLVGLFLKVPVATWILSGIGLGLLLQKGQSRTTAYCLLPWGVPAITIFVIASCQTGMNRHIRYVFSMLPLIYLIGSLTHARWPRISIGLLSVTIFSSLTIFPHSLSYFNESIGGPSHGHKYLIDSNLDWGQDMLQVREWLNEHPEARPAWVAWIGEIPLSDFGIDAQSVPARERKPGWYLVSRHEVHNPQRRLESFKKLQPVDQIGYTFDVYRLEN